MNIPRDQKFTAMRRAWVFEQFHHSIVKAYHCHTDSMLADANSKRFSASDQAVNARNLQGHGAIKANSTVDGQRIMTWDLFLMENLSKSFIGGYYSFIASAFKNLNPMGYPLESSTQGHSLSAEWKLITTGLVTNICHHMFQLVISKMEGF